jgi:hypothetical protein
MPRTIVITEKPIYHPYACIQCGLNGPPREYFIDLGFVHSVFIADFNIYLCNECWPNLSNAVSSEVSKWQVTHADWDSPEAVYPTYEWEGTLNFEEVTSKGIDHVGGESGSVSGQQSTDTEQTSEGTTLTVPGFGEGDNRDNQDAEPNDSESEHPDSVDATTDDDPDDDAAKQVFSAFFGEQ